MRQAPIPGFAARLELGWLDVRPGYNEVAVDTALFKVAIGAVR
jgi:hypothetical protein